MEFKFYTHKDYHTVEEKRHLKEFFALGLRSGYICKNKKGEERKIHKINFPEEFIIDGSTVYQYDDRKDSHLYYTPLATMIGAKEGMVIYSDDSGMYNISSSEFMKWLGGEWSYSVEEKEDIVPEFVKQRLEALKSKEKNTAKTKEEFKEKTENWNPSGKINQKKVSKKKKEK